MLATDMAAVVTFLSKSFLAIFAFSNIVVRVAATSISG